MTAADTFREIDTLASVARQTFNNGGDSQVVRGNLAGIQLAAQAGLRDALADARKLEAYPHLLAGTRMIIASTRKQASDFDECAVHYREVAGDAQDAIGRPGSEVDLTELLAFARKTEVWLRHRVDDFTKCAANYRSIADGLDAGLATIPQQQVAATGQAAVIEAFAALAKENQRD